MIIVPQRFNVLLVDDSQAAAKLFELAMREVAPAASVYWVASGEEAIEALERRGRFIDVLGFDVVVMDMNMPRADGFRDSRAYS